MNRRAITTLAVLTGCWLLFGAAGTADAGFISATVDHEAAAFESASGMAPASEDGETASHIRDLARWFQQHAAWAGPFAPASGGAAGTPATTAFSGGAPAALLSVGSEPQSELVTLLAPDRDLWIPPPFLSGIFRPPRFSMLSA